MRAVSVLRWEGPAAPRRYLPPISSARRVPLIGRRDATPPPPSCRPGARRTFPQKCREGARIPEKEGVKSLEKSF